MLEISQLKKRIYCDMLPALIQKVTVWEPKHCYYLLSDCDYLKQFDGKKWTKLKVFEKGYWKEKDYF